MPLCLLLSGLLAVYRRQKEVAAAYGLRKTPESLRRKALLLNSYQPEIFYSLLLGQLVTLLICHHFKSEFQLT